MLAQKRKEKMMTKKQQQADTRNKRMAFKEKLEAQSPKVYVIVINNDKAITGTPPPLPLPFPLPSPSNPKN